MGVVPDWSLATPSGRSQGALSAIERRIVGIECTQTADRRADSLLLRVEDFPGVAPPAGTEMELSLGWRGEPLVSLGSYTYAGREEPLMPRILDLHWSAVPFARGASWDVPFSRTWPEGTTLGTLAAGIADRNGMTAHVAPPLAAAPVPVTQLDRSDLAWLTEQADRHDADVRVLSGRVVVLSRLAGATVSGIALAAAVTPDEPSDARLTTMERPQYGAVEAAWYDFGAAQLVTVRAGDDAGPAYRLPVRYANAPAAEAAARRFLTRVGERSHELSMTLPGRPDILPEMTLDLTGPWPPRWPTTWRVHTVSHTIADRPTFRTTLSAAPPPPA